MYVKSNSAWGLLEMTVLATAVAGLLYFGYFQLAPWIWSQNKILDVADLPVWYREEVGDRDGNELYALYVLMFLNLFFVYALSYGWNRLAGRPIRYLLVLPLVAVACIFIASIGFEPPMNTLAGHTVPDLFVQSFMLMAAILPMIALLYYLQKRSAFWGLAIAALLLIPVCFIATSPIEWYDYSYILAPASRLFHGAVISEVYFQYDLLISLIGLAWMKLQLDLNQFQVIAQCAYYLLLLCIFAFSRRWFLDKRLAVFLLAALVLVRIYPGLFDAVHSFQTTPVRLDLWLILLLLVYFKGPHHWSAGLFCGLLLLLHHNFGIIYSAAYIQLLLTLCLIDTAMIPGQMIKTVSSALSTFFRKNHLNLALMLAGVLAHYLLFRNVGETNKFNIINSGIGFIKIATNSFYWYVVVVLGLSFVLLIRLRSIVSRSYLVTGFCLVYLAIGNSLYFFGRSHENNIINISPVLLVLFFLMLDLAGRFLADDPGELAKSFIRRNLAVVAAFAFLASITIWYGDSIADRAAIQAQNAGKGQFIYPSNVPEQYIKRVIADVRSVTGDEPKVYFVGDHDFLFNYYGGYAPVGFYNPVYAWIPNSGFDKFLQGLIDQGYYAVVDNGIVTEVLPHISFSHIKSLRGRFVVWE